MDAQEVLDKIKSLIEPEDLVGKTDHQIVKGYQEASGLVPDGKLGDVTALDAERPRRCGNKLRLSNQRAIWDHSLWNPKTGQWRGTPANMKLTYYIEGTFPDFTRQQTEKIFAESWARWSKVCAIVFVQITNSAEANIVIRFAKIDESGQTLAWMELPFGPNQQLSGQFDTSEVWSDSLDPPNGRIGAPHVATHEEGHAIGIDHLGERQLMAPFYDRTLYEPQAEDIKEAQLRYGPPVPETPTTPPPLPPTNADQQLTVTISDKRGNKWHGTAESTKA